MNLIFYARKNLTSLAEILAILLAVSLPWSTSATSVIAVFWLLTFVPICELATMRRIVSSPAGALPLLILAFGALGMLWAEVTWSERLNGISSFLKLLSIPLLMCQFSRSDRANLVLIGFLASCTVLLLVSWMIFIWPNLPLPLHPKTRGIPVKDYISQGTMFTMCVAIFMYLICEAWSAGRRHATIVLSVIGMLFLANIFYIATSRTSLIAMPTLLVLFGYRQLGWRGALASIVGFLLLAAAAWPSAGYLRERVNTFIDEIHSYRPDGAPTSAGERLVYWTKSVEFIEAAPIIGHGTGSIRQQFERSTIGRTGMAAEVSANPHNQILAVGIQLGFVGVIMLIAMWISHLMLFRAAGLASWAGLIVVVANIVGSQFNSHIFDFTHGWAYAAGVGIAGGIVLKKAATPEPLADSERIKVLS